MSSGLIQELPQPHKQFIGRKVHTLPQGIEDPKWVMGKITGLEETTGYIIVETNIGTLTIPPHSHNFVFLN